MSPTRSLLFIGPFPSPVTGQTVSTDVLARALRKRGVKLTTQNIVRGDSDQQWYRYLVRAARLFRAAVAILASIGRNRSIYISVDANRGMWISVCLSTLARWCGQSTVLHYHSYSHLSKANGIARCLVRMAGPSADHMHICPFMSDRAVRLYPKMKIRSSLSNAHVIRISDDGKNKVSSDAPLPFVLGFLGRLSEEKGAGLAIDVLSMLRKRGRNVQLVLAGPMTSNSEFVSKAQLAYKEQDADCFQTPGMLGPEGKHEFYHSIDCFLFPTQYKNETQGIVNLEAMAYGVPVIAYGRCCVRDDVGDQGGMVIDPNDDFVSIAVETVERWMDDPTGHVERRKSAKNRFEELYRLSNQEIDGLIQRHQLSSQVVQSQVGKVCDAEQNLVRGRE